MDNFKEWMVKSILVRAGRVQELKQTVDKMKHVYKDHVCCTCDTYIPPYTTYEEIVIIGSKCDKCSSVYCESCANMTEMYCTDYSSLNLCHNCADLPKCDCLVTHPTYILCNCGEKIALEHSPCYQHHHGQWYCNKCANMKYHAT